jgi:hypothetical protein
VVKNLDTIIAKIDYLHKIEQSNEDNLFLRW